MKKIRNNKGNMMFNYLNTFLMMLLSLIFILPLFHVFMASISDSIALMRHTGIVTYPLSPITIYGYRTVLVNSLLPLSYLNSFGYVAATVAAGLLVCGLAAYSLADDRFRLKGLLMAYICVTMLFNGGLIPTFIVIRDLGLLDSGLSLILPMIANAFNIILLRTAFIGVPKELVESASIEGASDLFIAFRIVIPLSKSTFAAIGMLLAISQWNSWFPASLYLTTQSKFPLQLMLNIILQNATTGINGLDMATKMKYADIINYACVSISIIPLICLYPFIQRYFQNGIMIGAIK